MHKIDGYGATGANTFTEGDPSANPPVPATMVTDDWLNAVQGEIVAAIEGAGIVLDKDVNTQLRAALRKGAGSLVNADMLDDAHLSTDGTMASDSDAKVPSEKAVRAYVGTYVGAMAGGTKFSAQDGGSVSGGTVNLPSIAVNETMMITYSYSGAPTFNLPAGGTYNRTFVSSGNGSDTQWHLAGGAGVGLGTGQVLFIYTRVS